MAEKERKRRKKTAEGEAKEHKTPWQEKYASPDEIEDFLKDHIHLRRNVVTLRTEYRDPSEWKEERGEWKDFAPATDRWQPMSDWKLNTLWRRMMKEKPVLFDHMKKVINSDSFQDYHPFRYYLEHLPPWDRKNDYILEMSVSVNVKGGPSGSWALIRTLSTVLGASMWCAAPTRSAVRVPARWPWRRKVIRHR